MARLPLPSLSHVLLTLAAIAAVSVAGWVIFAGLSTQHLYQVEAAKAADQAADRARAQMKRDCGPLSSADQSKCISDISNTYRSYRKETRDLEAQRSTALWTALMGAAALIGMAVSVIGVGLVYLTFQASRRSADAANDTLEHERKRSAAELRPWVTIELEITKFKADEKTVSIDYEILIKNIGKTLAQPVKFLAEGEYEVPSLVFADQRFAAWDEIALVDRLSFALMPGEERRFSGAYAKGKPWMPWMDTAPRQVSFLVAVSVLYRSEIDDLWHRTDRSFTVGEKDRTHSSGIWIKEDWNADGAPLVEVRPLQAGETT